MERAQHERDRERDHERQHERGGSLLAPCDPPARGESTPPAQPEEGALTRSTGETQ